MLFGCNRLSCKISSLLVVAMILGVLTADILSLKTSQATSLGLPEPGQLLKLKSDYKPALLRGVRLNPVDPLNISFILDLGQERKIKQDEIKTLLSYFLTALTVPKEDIWVNLSPYESDRIIEEKIESTDMGKDLLAQDYLLKQLSASLTHPDTTVGQEYWNKLRSLDSFSKIWISPEESELYVGPNFAVIEKATLKLEAEKDYLAYKFEKKKHSYEVDKSSSLLLDTLHGQVNNSQHFAKLKQIYHAIILATWFKKNFSNSFYKHYIDKSKTSGLKLDDKSAKDKIYSLYCDAFKRGVYDFIRKEIQVEKYQSGSNRKVAKRYFSGGIGVSQLKNKETKISSAMNLSNLIDNKVKVIDLTLSSAIGDKLDNFDPSLLISKKQFSDKVKKWLIDARANNLPDNIREVYSRLDSRVVQIKNENNYYDSAVIDFAYDGKEIYKIAKGIIPNRRAYILKLKHDEKGDVFVELYNDKTYTKINEYILFKEGKTYNTVFEYDMYIRSLFADNLKLLVHKAKNKTYKKGEKIIANDKVLVKSYKEETGNVFLRGTIRLPIGSRANNNEKYLIRGGLGEKWIGKYVYLSAHINTENDVVVELWEDKSRTKKISSYYVLENGNEYENLHTINDESNSISKFLFKNSIEINTEDELWGQAEIKQHMHQQTENMRSIRISPVLFPGQDKKQPIIIKDRLAGLDVGLVNYRLKYRGEVPIIALFKAGVDRKNINLEDYLVNDNGQRLQYLLAYDGSVSQGKDNSLKYINQFKESMEKALSGSKFKTVGCFFDILINLTEKSKMSSINLGTFSYKGKKIKLRVGKEMGWIQGKAYAELKEIDKNTTIIQVWQAHKDPDGVYRLNENGRKNYLGVSNIYYIRLNGEVFKSAKQVSKEMRAYYEEKGILSSAINKSNGGIDFESLEIVENVSSIIKSPKGLDLKNFNGFDFYFSLSQTYDSGLSIISSWMDLN